jgi:hypothetical protein
MSCSVATLHIMLTMNVTSKLNVTPINVAVALPEAAGLLKAECSQHGATGWGV